MKVALVTGASRGIGAEIAKKLYQEGYVVVINYSGNKDAASKVLEDIDNNGLIYKANVKNYDECEAMVNETISRYGQIDLLVNNAGITKDNLLLRMTNQDFNDVIDVNLVGAFNMCKLVSKYMMKQRCGRIINMSSVVGIHGNIGQANYSASKGGLIALTKSLAKELAARNILVNAIAPGFISTDMTSVLNDATKDAVLKQIPLQKIGEVEDIANLVVFLASDKAKYITGQIIGVDGGMGI